MEDDISTNSLILYIEREIAVTFNIEVIIDYLQDLEEQTLWFDVSYLCHYTKRKLNPLK